MRVSLVRTRAAAAARLTRWVATASIIVSCYAGQIGGTDGGGRDAARVDAHGADGTLPEAALPDATLAHDGSSPPVDATEDTTIAIVCPKSPPVNLGEIPGFNAACTDLVLVAGGSTGDAIAVSVNASGTWTTAFTPVDAGQYSSMNSFAFGYGYGLAVGSNVSVITANGTSWGSADGGVPPSGFNYKGFAFLNNMFVFLAPQQGSGYSFNGTTWSFVTNGNPYTTGALANFGAQGVSYGLVGADGGSNMYIAVGATSTQALDGGSVPSHAGYRTSTDGENWSNDIAITDSSGNELGGFLSAITFCNGHFVIVGDGNGSAKPNADGLIAWSTDGVTWHVQTDADRDGGGQINFGTVACSGSTFIAAGNIYSHGQWTSTDGETWTMNQSAPGFGQLAGLENYFIAGPIGGGAAKGTISLSSDNGKTWMMQTAFTSEQSVASVGVGRVLKSQ